MVGSARRAADVAIVGGGPAGAAAAIAARRLGLDVLLLERNATPAERPGESVHPGIEALLRQLDVWDDVLAADFPRHDGHWSAWGGAPRFEPFGHDANGPWRGLSLWRPTFDALLLARAQRAGAAVVRPCRDVRPIVRRGRVTGLQWSGGRARARFVIDATGRRRWLAKALDLSCERASGPLVAWYGYARGSCPGRDAAPAIAADASGWTWTAMVSPGLYQWVQLRLDGTRPERDWRPSEFADLAPARPTRAADVSWTLVRPTAGAGYVLAGDAAVVLDPASSHGVLTAVMSGMAAAHAAAAVVRGACEGAATADYDAWMRERFARDTTTLRRAWEALAGDTRP